MGELGLLPSELVVVCPGSISELLIQEDPWGPFLGVPSTGPSQAQEQRVARGLVCGD